MKKAIYLSLTSSVVSLMLVSAINVSAQEDATVSMPPSEPAKVQDVPTKPVVPFIPPPGYEQKYPRGTGEGSSARGSLGGTGDASTNTSRPVIRPGMPGKPAMGDARSGGMVDVRKEGIRSGEINSPGHPMNGVPMKGIRQEMKGDMKEARQDMRQGMKEMRDDKKILKQNFRADMVRKELQGAAMVIKNLRTRVEELKKASTNIESRLKELGTKGLDVTKAEENLAISKTKIEKAEADVATAQTTIESYGKSMQSSTGTGENNTGNNSTNGTSTSPINKEAKEAVKKAVKTANESLQDARKSLLDIIKPIKEQIKAKKIEDRPKPVETSESAKTEEQTTGSATQQ